MAERKKKRGKNEPATSNKLTKEDESIAKFIRFNCPTNSTMFEGNEVHYFSGKKAIDLLVESKKYGVNSKAPKFTTFIQAEHFLQSLMEHGLFFRARKVVLKKKDKTDGKAIKETKDTPNTRKQKLKKEAEAAETTNNEDETVNNNEEQEGEEKKKKKKIKLLAHEIQSFVMDSGDVYVWIFDPTPWYKQLIGLLMVLGVILGCLFPLWPDWLRLGIYYLSITGIACFGALLGVALLRSVLFGILWTFTFGRWKLWVLPNLTEDCGFFESFKPFYTFEYDPNAHWFATCKPKKIEKDSVENEDEKDALINQEEENNEEIKLDDEKKNE